jgi:hypothetical protein
MDANRGKIRPEEPFQARAQVARQRLTPSGSQPQAGRLQHGHAAGAGSRLDRAHRPSAEKTALDHKAGGWHREGLEPSLYSEALKRRVSWEVNKTPDISDGMSEVSGALPDASDALSDASDATSDASDATSDASDVTPDTSDAMSDRSDMTSDVSDTMPDSSDVTLDASDAMARRAG